MSNSDLRGSRIDELLAQDAALATFPFDEFRRKLEQSVRELEGRARRNHRAALLGVSVFIACAVALVPLKMLGLLENRVLALLVAGTGVVAMLVTGLLGAIYQYRYQPALQRSQSELQSAMIAQLQQQVAELRTKVAGESS
jgi:hypothetical protein